MNLTYAQPVGPRTVFTLLLLALAGAFSSPSAWGQANANPPERLTYQGYVVDANGNPLGATSPRNYDIIFRIWNDATTTSAANRFWTEQQTVTVDKGYFSVLLGEGASIGEPRPVLSTLFTNATASDRWVGITVKGIGAGTPPADVDILPRIRLLTSPYAFLASKALSVDGAALQSGIVADARLSANVALRSGGNTFAGNQVINGNVGLGVANPTNSLQVSGVAQVGYLNIQAQDGGNEGGELFLKGAGANANWHIDTFAGRIRMFSPGNGEHFSLLSNGRLGLGTSSPAARLDVNGSAAVGYLNIRKGNDTGEGGELVLDGSGTNSFWAIDSWNDGIRTFNDKGLGWAVRGNGNMGVGTIDPQAKLHVVGSNPFPHLKVSAAAAAPFGAFLSLDATATTGGKNYQIFSTGGSAGEGQGNLVFQNYSDGVSGMTLTSTGQLNVVKGVNADFFTSRPGMHGNEAARIRSGGAGDIVTLKSEGSGSTYKITIWSEKVPTYFKTFIIPHPANPEKYLVHAAIEGSEVAVFYRGSAQLQNGRAVIQLPTYFEALTQTEGRTIQLTGVDGFDRLAVQSQGGARIVDGQFEVYSDNIASSQRFDWEVKARRQDSDRLVVEPDRSEISVRGDGPYTYAEPKGQ
jgi:hypothetical protein